MRQLNHIRWLVAVVVLATLPVVAQVRDTLYFSTLSRTVEAITVGQETFSRYSYPGCDHIDQVGAPMLPVKYIRLSVPYNATNIRVTTPGSSYLTQPVSRRIYPAPVPLTTNDTIPDTPELVIDSAIYMTNAFWPPLPAQLVGDGFYMGENRIITVAVRPMLYNPVTSKTRNYSQVRVNVIYDLGGTPANMLVRRGGDLRQQEQQSAKAMVENPQQVEGFAMPATQAFHLPAHGLLPDSALTDTASYYYGGELYTWGDRARYLIVTTRDLAPSFKRLAALKRQKGYSVQIKCIEYILADPRVQHGDVFVNTNGDTISTINDDAGKLRQYLKLAHAYDNTQFVLLGGKNVPYRYGWRMQTRIPTDQYFTDLSTIWTYNVNSDIYVSSNYDLSPELFVGRLLGDSCHWIENYIDKLFRYELNPGHSDFSYLRRCFSFEKRSSLGYSDSITSNFGDIFTTYDLQREQDQAPYNTGNSFISAINTNHYGFVDIFAHGSPNGIQVCKYSPKKCSVKALHNQNKTPHQNDWLQESHNGLDNLENKYYPFVLYTSCCSTMPFDIYSPSYYTYDVKMNVGESFTLGKDYGGVAYLGNTRDSYTDSMPRLGAQFAIQISMGKHIGEAEAQSKVLFGGVYHAMVNNLLGDPEFRMWTNEPMQYSSITVTRIGNLINISGLPVYDNNESIVALLSNDGTSRWKTVASGSTTFTNVNPNSLVMVYQHNYLPYIAPLYLQNERISHSQHVIANDVYAGREVDCNRTVGDITIATGVEYELDAKGQVVLSPGFIVEKGALFSVCHSDY